MTTVYFDIRQLWLVGGWTMLHFLWLGTLVALVAAVVRLTLHRASPNVRYAAALVCLVLITALPVGIAGWIAAKPQAADRAAGEETIELSGRDAGLPAEFAPGGTGSASDLPGERTDPVNASPILTVSTGKASGTLTTAVAALESCARYLPWLWIVGTPITFVLLATGVVGAERLRRGSSMINEGPIAETCAQLVKALGIGRRVAVAVCERIAAPVLVGIARPIILLPPAALTGWSPDEIEMVLLHELAHVRRWDNLVNLIQRLVESLLFFHPAVWWASGWVRREREACCDAVVVGRTNRPHAYAEMLVALAAQMPRSVLFHPAASSSMAAGPLRSRISRILQLEDDPMLVSGKSLAVVMSGLLLAATLVVLNLPTRGDAEELTTKVTKSTKNTESSTEEQVEESRLSSEDWPEGFNFPSPKDREIAKEAWFRLGLKLVPATAEDLAQARVSHGLKVVDGEYIPKDHVNIPEPLILVKVDNKIAIKDFDDLDSVLRRLKVNPRPTLAIELHQWFYSGGSSMGGTQNLFARYHAEPEKAGHKFPSLEEQRWADLAWKRLGVELEDSVGPEVMKALQKSGYQFGFEDGVKVADVWANFGKDNEVQPGDILVGLHVWPTKNLQDVAQVLTRPDLGELNPLKFYVIRKDDQGFRVVTGRIEVNLSDAPYGSKAAEAYEPSLNRTDSPGELDSLFAPAKPSGVAEATTENEELAEAEALVREAQQGYLAASQQYPRDEEALSKAEEQYRQAQQEYDAAQSKVDQIAQEQALVAASAKPQAAGDSAADKSALRYDGRTFDEWRDQWRNDLSTEKRLAAVKALAAFGANGYGKEAAEAILKVAGQYDWMVIGDNEGILPLQNACITAFGAPAPMGRGEGIVGQHLLPQDALPVLLDVVRSDNRRIRLFLRWVLTSFDDPKAIDALLELSKDSDPEVSWSAINALPAIDSEHPKEKLVERVREGLTNEDADDDEAFIRKLIPEGRPGGGPEPEKYLYYLPELYPKLFSPHERVRCQARLAIQYIQPDDAAKVTEQLVEILRDDTRREQHVEALRALAAMKRKAALALPEIEKFLVDSIDPNDPRLVSAAVAKGMMLPNEGRDEGGDLAQQIKRLGYLREPESAIAHEQMMLFSGDGDHPSRGFGGGGGVF